MWWNESFSRTATSPPSRTTRIIRRRASTGSGRLYRLWAHQTRSKVSSRNGSRAMSAATKRMRRPEASRIAPRRATSRIGGQDVDPHDSARRADPFGDPARIGPVAAGDLQHAAPLADRQARHHLAQLGRVRHRDRPRAWGRSRAVPRRSTTTAPVFGSWPSERSDRSNSSYRMSKRAAPWADTSPSGAPTGHPGRRPDRSRHAEC